MYEHHTISKTKVSLIVLFLVGVCIGYDQLFVNRVTAQETPLSALTVESLSIINKIEALKLDNSILNDEAFMSLEDYSVLIEKEPVGRPNPFAPFTGQVSQPRGR
ncbi:hypothetical protein KW782_00570 [Candidatus Parcubacteria bacterium]|nr:hypothetical protein [Candidatus Parcubacteria bacterium]